MTKASDIGCGGRRRRRAVPPLDSFSAETATPRRTCDHPGCDKEGTHRAPKDRSLRTYYWFCLEHVQAYNKSWNYYEGMTEADIERDIRLSACWDRPTWPLGKGATWGDRFDPANLHDPLGVFAEDAAQTRAQAEAEHPRPPRHREDGPRARALRILDLDEPVTLATLKDRYKALCKRYHPDANGGDKEAEERFKVVNEAYHTLVAALAP